MHQEALTKQSAALFPKFAKFKTFYLVGGTALALHIGHRLSVDFDFFSFDELPPNLLRQTKQVFPRASISVTYRAPEQLNILINDIKATFFQYDYPVIDPLIRYRSISLASIREIAAMKAFAVGKRLAYKDYVDWYFLLKEKHVELHDVIAFCKKKFGNDFNDRLFLGQLVSFDDVPSQKIDFMYNPVDRPTIQKFLRVAVRAYKF